MGAAPAALPNLCPLRPPLPRLGNSTGSQPATGHGSPVRSLCAREKIIRKEDVRYGPTAPGQPMSRSEICCCIAGSETRSGLLLHGSGNLPPNLPTSGCSQGGSMHCGCCAALYHCRRRAFGVVELWRKPASVPCLPPRLWTGSGAASWRPPGSHGLRARLGLPSKPVPPCRRQTDPDSISGWDKKKRPPHCL